MTWLPDWKNMERAFFSVAYLDEDDYLYETEIIEVSIESDDQYRLLEQPLFDEILTWGDLIEARKTNKSTLRLIKIIEHAEHTRTAGIGSGIPVGDAFDKIMADGGFWQEDMGGLMTIFFPPGKSAKDYTK